MKKVKETMKYLSSLILCLAALLIPFAASAEPAAGTVPDLISKIVRAYGGKGTIERIRSIYAKGHIDAISYGEKGLYSIYFERPRKLRVDIDYGKSSEHRILNGDKGYYGTGGSIPSRVSGNSYLATVYQYKSMDIPFGLLNDRYRVSYGEEVNFAGRKAAVLVLRDAEGPPIKVYVDLVNFLIVGTSGFFSAGEDMTVLSSEFSDFRKVDGTIFPFRIANFAEGRKVADTVMTEYKVNTPLADSLFRPASPPVPRRDH